ncbi:MAG: phosphatidate cytidylyltransferase [Sediminibacterium sp.]|nr:phosphatidate cytidylyltransferase [Sediminibacterium sp.]
MAFNLQIFRTRTLTAIVFVMVMLFGLLWNQWSFLLLFSVIHIGCWVEYQKLVGQIDKDYQEISFFHQYGILFAGWGLQLWMTNELYQIGQISIQVAGQWMFLIGFLLFIAGDFLSRKEITPRLWAYSMLGLVYISLSWGLMMRLWSNLHQTVFAGENWLLPVLLIASIWLNDTMAYLVGSFIGKTPLSPISPKKTWEGTIGGAILTVPAVVLTGFYAFHLPFKPLLLISVTATIAGTAGDLFESKLKRLAGVKDSGRIMPGHGGFLDRFDSLLVATTVCWIIFYLFY